MCVKIILQPSASISAMSTKWEFVDNQGSQLKAVFVFYCQIVFLQALRTSWYVQIVQKFTRNKFKKIFFGQLNLWLWAPVNLTGTKFDIWITSIFAYIRTGKKLSNLVSRKISRGYVTLPRLTVNQMLCPPSYSEFYDDSQGIYVEGILSSRDAFKLKGILSQCYFT